MSPEHAHDLPILTDVVELKAREPGMAGIDVAGPGSTEAQLPRGMYSDADVEALQAEVVSRALGITDELLHNAMRDIEATLFERVHDRLRTELPHIIATAIQNIGRSDD